MATDERLKARLFEWGAWFSAGGANMIGFPRTNVLHQSWMPPADGLPPSMQGAPAKCEREVRVHQAIGALSDKLIVVMVGKYGKRFTSAQMALALCCTSSAIEGRIGMAHALLSVAITD